MIPGSPHNSRGSLLSRALMRVAALAPQPKRMMWKWVYESLSRRGGLGDFMNFGYTPLDGETLELELRGDDRPRRHVIQLYHRTVAAAELAGKDVLEVGCGRGGGADYMARYLQPRSVTGVDIARGNVAFCRQVHDVPGLTFREGDAEQLPLPDARYDVVVNVESSHCYGSFERFVGEVCRVLRPGGAFMFSDMRGSDSHHASIEEVAETFRNCPLEVVEYTDITANVLASLEQEHERIEKFLHDEVPRLLRSSTRDLVGGQGGRWNDALRRGEAKYVHYFLRKP